MKIKVLGSGSAFSMNNWQSNYLITNEERNQYGEVIKRNMLLDCGSDIRFALKDAGLTYKEIDMVYISHLHADHCGGLEYLAFCRFFDPVRSTHEISEGQGVPVKPFLYGQSQLLRDLWNQTLRGGLSSVEGKEMEMDDYFTASPLYVNKTAEISNFGTINIIQTIHIMNGYGVVPTFGLMVTPQKFEKRARKYQNVYFTTDTQFNPDQIIKFYKEADLIIQDCETAKYESRVHAHYNKLKTLPKEIKKKMWLTHYNEMKQEVMVDGFLGFLEKGQEIVI